MGIRVKQKGGFKKTFGLLETVAGRDLAPLLRKYGEEGVQRLKAATPKDSGKTAESWIFTMEERKGELVVNWSNTNTNEGANVAILLQYGHIGPGDVYVEGRDYINPAIQPVIKNMKDVCRKWAIGALGAAAHYIGSGFI